MSRHEVLSISTHALRIAGRYKQTKQNVLQDIGVGVITELQTLFATALKAEALRLSQSICTYQDFKLTCMKYFKLAILFLLVMSTNLGLKISI